MAEGGPPPTASASAYPKGDVNEQYLKSMVEMGIHRDDARQVLFSLSPSILVRLICITGLTDRE